MAFALGPANNQATLKNSAKAAGIVKAMEERDTRVTHRDLSKQAKEFMSKKKRLDQFVETVFKTEGDANKDSPNDRDAQYASKWRVIPFGERIPLVMNIPTKDLGAQCNLLAPFELDDLTRRAHQVIPESFQVRPDMNFVWRDGYTDFRREEIYMSEKHLSIRFSFKSVSDSRINFFDLEISHWRESVMTTAHVKSDEESEVIIGSIVDSILFQYDVIVDDTVRVKEESVEIDGVIIRWMNTYQRIREHINTISCQSRIIQQTAKFDQELRKLKASEKYTIDALEKNLKTYDSSGKVLPVKKLTFWENVGIHVFMNAEERKTFLEDLRRFNIQNTTVEIQEKRRDIVTNLENVEKLKLKIALLCMEISLVFPDDLVLTVSTGNNFAGTRGEFTLKLGKSYNTDCLDLKGVTLERIFEHFEYIRQEYQIEENQSRDTYTKAQVDNMTENGLKLPF